MVFFVILFIIVSILLWVIATYNKLIELRNMVKDQWSQVDVQLKKRFDLIPNLVEVAKGYAKHEKETFLSVVEARESAMNAKTPGEEIESNDILTDKIKGIFMLSEAYPELKSNESFIELQKDLSDVEEKIAYARQFYNDAVMKYQTAIETFPTIIVANLLGFKKQEFFVASVKEKENINVKF